MHPATLKNNTLLGEPQTKAIKTYIQADSHAYEQVMWKIGVIFVILVLKKDVCSSDSCEAPGG